MIHECLLILVSILESADAGVRCDAQRKPGGFDINYYRLAEGESNEAQFGINPGTHRLTDDLSVQS